MNETLHVWLSAAYHSAWLGGQKTCTYKNGLTANCSFFNLFIFVEVEVVSSLLLLFIAFSP